MGMRLPQVTAGTIARLLVASLAVGMVMAFLGLTPREIVSYATGFARDAVENAQAWLGAFVSYVLLGAVIVVPIWLASVLLKSFRR